MPISGSMFHIKTEKIYPCFDHFFDLWSAVTGRAYCCKDACSAHIDLPRDFNPKYCPFPWSSSSMRKSWLYLATRSVRETDRVLICPVLSATERSAIVVSSVSPERCEIIAVYPALFAFSTVSTVSLRVPI